jgi:hypothetical protein
MVKICQTGLLFSGFCQKFPQAMDEVEKIFFANFQILGPLGCQGWVVIPQNVKKCKNHCTLLYILCTYMLVKYFKPQTTEYK